MKRLSIVVNGVLFTWLICVSMEKNEINNNLNNYKRDYKYFVKENGELKSRLSWYEDIATGKTYPHWVYVKR